MIYPEFVENQKFYSMDSSKSELMKLMNLAENFKKLQYLTTKHYQNFDQLIQEYLKTGNGIFDMKIGIVSKIEGDEYYICNVDIEDHSITKGDVFSVEGTYCREVVRSNRVICFPHVGMLDEMKSHPVYENMRLESYISAPIYVYNKLFGTLNFSSTETRQYGFSEHERDFISIMANSIGSFLELRQKESELVESNGRLKKLVGYVAHDLRNPLGSIQTTLDMIESSENTIQNNFLNIIRLSSEQALEIVHTILETAAIGTGKVELKPVRVDLSAMIQKKVNELDKLLVSKDIQLKSTIKENVFADIDENRMQQVLDNLCSNIVKYTPKAGIVEVSLNVEADEKPVVSFKNTMVNRPTLQQEDFDIKKSVGFGLEIIREILRLHNSKLNLSSAENYFIASFAL